MVVGGKLAQVGDSGGRTHFDKVVDIAGLVLRANGGRFRGGDA